MKLGLWDISRPHFLAETTRELYVQIPDEDKDPTDKEMCSLLNRIMYGTQDASNLCRRDYVKLLSFHGVVFDKASFPTFYKQEADSRGLVQGDDLAVWADEDGFKDVDQEVREKYSVEWTATMGGGQADDQEGLF